MAPSLPNYGLDPDALTANFDIYKKQNAYDTQMAQNMLAYEHDHNGSLKGWEQQWYSKNNFSTGPLDNLFGDAKSGQLSTGKGDGGGQTSPPGSTASEPITVNSAADYANVPSGKTYKAPDGHIRRKP